MSATPKIVTFYGASWCGDCRRSQSFLLDNNVEFSVTDIDNDPIAVNEVVRINKGYKSIPTIVFSDGTILVEPSNRELAEKLQL